MDGPRGAGGEPEVDPPQNLVAEISTTAVSPNQGTGGGVAMPTGGAAGVEIPGLPGWNEALRTCETLGKLLGGIVTSGEGHEGSLGEFQAQAGPLISGLQVTLKGIEAGVLRTDGPPGDHHPQVTGRECSGMFSLFWWFFFFETLFIVLFFANATVSICDF